jgi:8-amino-7-oxononanoate synthase
MNDFSFVDKELDLLIKENLKRETKTVLTAGGPWVETSTGKRVLQFGSNNYLGLANHPEIINACKNSVGKFGAGSTGARLLSGTTELHAQLEKAIADFEGTEDSTFFSSGYLTNLGVISGLAGKEDAIYSDELNHASMIDGIRLSRAEKFIYKHSNENDLEELVKSNSKKYRRNFIISETVFSMDGDIAPLGKIAGIAEKYNCITIIDEAHATGIFGKNSRGMAEEAGLENKFPIRIGTCSKALGVEGGFCAASKNINELLKTKSRAFMFSTSPSPAICGAILKSIDLIKDGNWRKEKLWENAKKLHSGLKKNYKLKLNEFKAPIICIYFDNIQETLNLSERLFNECHIWAPAIRPPSVSSPRIRLTPTSSHSEDDINYVIKAFEHVSRDLKAQPITF